MAPRGRGGSRGGFRGRGGGRGRGRGGARGGSGPGQRRGGARPHFSTERLAKQEDEVEEVKPKRQRRHEPQPEEDEEEPEPSEDEDEDETGPTTLPYMSLMKSLAESRPRDAKRRKIDHAPSAEEKKESQPQTAPDADDKDEDSEDDEDEEGVKKDLDEVDEPEEDPSNAPPEDLLDDEDDEEPDAADPFDEHFDHPDEEALRSKLEAIQQGKWRNERVAAKSGRMFVQTPTVGDSESASSSLPAPVSATTDLKLKKRLAEQMASKHAKLDPVEQTIAPLLFNYQDLLYCNRTVSSSESVRRMACLHAINHIFKTRDQVIKNNGKLAKHSGNDDLDLRDQGFTRPKVLVILPTRNSCVKMIEMITSICEPSLQENRKRFEEAYIDKDNSFSDEKPEDFRDLFSGSDDDMFRLGIKFTRKAVKYFSQFYNSDIIFGSPLGLRMAIGSEDDDSKKKKKKVDFDFLSSIELVVVDQADALLMQNWEHVEYVFEHLNIQPKDAHGCDFSRVRSWYLDDQAKYFRQTLIFSQFNTPELTELFRAHCQNWAGKVRLQQECVGVIQHLGVKARQTFSRFECPSVAADPDARFSYFTKAIVPTLTKKVDLAGGTLIFIPSYLDFVRVRNYFANNPAVEKLTFGTISEYADVPEASRARSHFLNGRHKVLLYTERAHHFRRYRIKGVQRVIMYGLPDNPKFYEEITGGFLGLSEQSLLLEPGQGTVKVVFSRYDVMKLERIVGTQRVAKMISERGDTFDFV